MDELHELPRIRMWQGWGRETNAKAIFMTEIFRGRPKWLSVIFDWAMANVEEEGPISLRPSWPERCRQGVGVVVDEVGFWWITRRRHIWRKQ